MTAVLETRKLAKRFGGIVAASEVSLRIEAGARHALIGPNGAGKTTLINLLSGLMRPTEGRILLLGRDITGLAAHQRARLGIARTFQINQLFLQLTPLESLTLAVCQRLGIGARFWRRLRREAAVVGEVAELMVRFHLDDAKTQPTARLPYGKQRLLEIALAIACRPRLLLLDEPAAGVPEHERQELLAVVAALPAEVSVLLIEHDMDLVFGFADRIWVLLDGRLLAEGTPEAIARDARVKAAYLGELVDG